MQLYLRVRTTVRWGSVLIAALLSSSLLSQTFTKITGTPITATTGPAGYTGASWVDFDGDHDLDLFINNNRLFRNDNVQFVQINTNIGSGQNLVTGNGNTWADYDNDGDLDVFVSSANSFLYRNDDTSFTKITTGDIGDGFANRGWSSAWADFNNDGYVDLAITHPAGFVPGGATPNHLFTNDGPPDFSFTRVTSGPIVTGLAPYTVGTWSDFDTDGDMDYFIGAGPANGSTAPDFLYRNLLVETGSADFERITTGIIATESQDGQVWNWIDYDNDGDRDAYLTNWGGATGGLQNRLYRNDSGTFIKITSGEIVTDSHISLSSVWGDFDNDGDLDCYVANDGNGPGGQPDRYYRNNGDGSFTADAGIAFAENLARRGATAGDYDNDGDLDLLAVGPSSALGLYRNDSNSGNSWINIECRGTASNRAAIGAAVRVRAQINGTDVWQLRDVLAQNNFNGQNSLRAHFGLGDATIIDSLVIDWPAGNRDVYTNVAPNARYSAEEGVALTGVTGLAPVAGAAVPGKISLMQNYPNPFNPVTNVEFGIRNSEFVNLTIFDLAGRKIATLVNEHLPAGTYQSRWDGRNESGKRVSSGVYFYRLQAGEFVDSKRMLMLK